jgi:hypothetical protein
LSATNATATSSKFEFADGPLTYRVFPAGKGAVNVRFDNLADWFDGGAPEATVDVNSFATELYKHANGISPTDIKIEEMDLQGVHSPKHFTPWKT